MDPIKVGVIMDWTRSARGNAWPQLLAKINADLPVETTLYPVADLLVQPVEDGAGLHEINKQDVLIINWDAANGDPEFGAHLALRWLDHRRPELLLWLARGKVLIVESQAVLGVPCAAAYSAAAGAGELPTSGLDDIRDPLGVARRVGLRCRKGKKFPDAGGFERVLDPVEIRTKQTLEEQFPPTATKLLTDQLQVLPPQVLYRGWFRRVVPGSRYLKWVSLLDADRRILRRHSVLKVAKHGSGAIFASTMLLASTGQKELVEAMLRCSRGGTQCVPTPRDPVAAVRTSWKVALTVVGGAVAGLVTSRVTSLPRFAWFFTGARKASDSGIVTAAVTLMFIAGGMLFFELGRRILAQVRRIILDVLGY